LAGIRPLMLRPANGFTQNIADCFMQNIASCDFCLETSGF